MQPSGLQVKTYEHKRAICHEERIQKLGDQSGNSLKMTKIPEACVGDFYNKNKNILQLVGTEIYG